METLNRNGACDALRFEPIRLLFILSYHFRFGAVVALVNIALHMCICARVCIYVCLFCGLNRKLCQIMSKTNTHLRSRKENSEEKKEKKQTHAYTSTVKIHPSLFGMLNPSNVRNSHTIIT